MRKLVIALSVVLLSACGTYGTFTGGWGAKNAPAASTDTPEVLFLTPDQIDKFLNPNKVPL